MTVVDKGSTREPIMTGAVGSLLIHAGLFYLIFFYLSPVNPNFGAPIVYSITLEGGKSLGGISQAPESSKSPLAPPKVVATPVTAKSNETEKAEISIKETKRTPVPTPKTTTTPKVASTKPPLKEPVKKVPDKKIPAASDPNKEYQKAMQRYLGESANAGGKGFGAAAIGGKGMGGGTLVSPEVLAYQNLLQSHVQSGWTWPDANSTLTAKVVFKIDKDGSVHDIRIDESSGSSEFDSSVLRAIFKANPVPAPPEKIYESFKEVRMIFDPRDRYITPR